MKNRNSLELIMLFGLIILWGCGEKEKSLSDETKGTKVPAVVKEKNQIPVTSKESILTSDELEELHSLKLTPVTTDHMSKDKQQVVHVRLKLEAKKPGDLLIRVREPLIAKNPEFTIGVIPGFNNSEKKPWSEVAKTMKTTGLRQVLLKLSEEDIGKQLEVDLQIIHESNGQEEVKVHLAFLRDNVKKEWLSFYHCRPITKTNRSSSTVMDKFNIITTGKTALISSYKFGGDATDTQVPLTEVGKQWVVLELGWKSSLDLTP